MDFNFDDKGASDSKKRLEEAKARLLEEKRRFKEEMRSAKSHGISHGEILKPWMIWDISIFITMIILFSVAMYYPRPGAELTGAAVLSNQTTTPTSQAITGSAILVVENISSGVTPSAVEEEELEGPPPRFSLIIEDKDGNSIEEIKTDADNVPYSIVIKNLEKEFIFCNGDRTIDDDVDEDYYKNLKVHPFETEKLPNTLLGSGRVEVKYDFSCRFTDGTKYSKLSTEFDAIFE